jgi:hypothetical protein
VRNLGAIESRGNSFAPVILAGLVLLVGCAQSTAVRPSAPGSISAAVRAEEHNLEVSATPEEQARQEVVQTPTVFSVPFADDPYSWERARFFLENYIGSSSGHTSVVTRVVGDRWSLASNPTVQQYVYEVSKDAGEGAYTYQVSCIPGTGGDINQAVLNAGNLARFIREGKLEISLLAPR